MLFRSTNSTQRGELLITFLDGNSAQNLLVGNPYGIQKITNFWLINMMLLSVGACIATVWKNSFLWTPITTFNSYAFCNSWRAGLIAERFFVVQSLHNAESY